jgi:hypothetical protein
MYDQERRIRGDAQQRAKAIGQQRQADQRRKCPVQGCEKKPKAYSRYCKRHADRLRSNGHPTLDVRVQSGEQYEKVLKIGRWVRHALTETDSDRLAWEGVERGLMRIGSDPKLMHDIPTVVRREKHWRNQFKAGIVLQRRFLPAVATGGDPKVIAEEIIAAYLGMAAVILKDNDVLVNRRQLMMFFNKAGARAITRHMRFVGADEHAPDKVYRWRPSAGTTTAVGAIVNEQVSYQFGKMWWKRVDLAVATLGEPPG